MRKSLALILAIAMVFSMFSSLAFAAETELTAQQKYDALAAKGIFAGMADGSAGLDQAMTRAQFARVAALIKGLEGIGAPDTKVVTVKPFSDVELGQWYTEEVAAAKEDGIFVGNADGTFNPNGDITVQELSVVVVTLLGLEVVADAKVDGAADWAAGYIKAIQDNGLPFPTNYTEAATRADLASLAFTADAVINPDVKVLAISSVAQSGAKTITANFNREVTADEKSALTFDVKNGLVPYTSTAKWAEGNKSVVLEFTFLPAGDYSVTVKGFDAATVKVEAEKVTKVEIQATQLTKAAAQDLKVKALNQFGEAVTGAIGDSNITAFNVKTGTAVAVVSGKVDLSAADIDSVIVITAAHPSTGLSATKNFTLVAASTPQTIQLGTVVPLKDKTRISVSETGFVLPYTMVDQYGQSIKLPTVTAPVAASTATNAKIGDIEFVVSGTGALTIPMTTLSVDADGVLKFNTTATSGTVVITALNSKTGASHSTTVKVEDAAKITSFQAQAPAQLVVIGETVKIPYVAADTFGAPIAAKDVPASITAATVAGNWSITDSSGSIVTTPVFKYNGDLEIVFTGTAGSNTVYFMLNGAIASQITFDVKAVATPVKIQAVKSDVKTTLGIGGTATLATDKVTFVDNYGRVKNIADLPGTHTLTITDDASVTTSVYGNVVTGVSAGSEKYTLGLDTAADGADAGTTLDVTFTVVANTDVKNFTISDVATLFDFDVAKAPGKVVANFDKALTLVGKTASGTDVAILASNFYTSITSSDTSIASIQGTSVRGEAKGTATVAFWNGATKIAETTVTVSDVAPVATAVKFTEASASIAGVATTVDVSTLLEIKDQYGVAIAGNGTYSSSNTAIANVNAAGLVTEVALANGETTISYVTNNGIAVTIVVVVTQ